ncbi:outer membrane beta-barrel family protein [Echinicola jeungdonensis]|uniref:Outer membrane beta-barrel protein n=1 Tax=Echinicola jeungdonensis TaxID=709343 RepID=A0ABV5J8H5_9BACT|nr:outer membrane beta-barrel family protein [Echinicola jeungdonensis]MDN3669433.1 outer membrane beta-barrel family protein [Echinicola jeungdonensis]
MKIPVQIFLMVLSFLLLSGHGLAQQNSQISGEVQDNMGKALPFVNIALLDHANGELIIGAVSDDSGRFNLILSNSGLFRLKISSIGFQTFHSEPLQIATGQKKDLGIIQLSEETTSLEEVEVNGNRPQVIIEADRTIVQIDGTVMAKGSNALEVVGRSPGVYVDGDGNIKLNGRSGVIVLIDERQTYMSAQELANYLRAMPADNIQSIEVINNPPAKYDAEGAAGVLNIILKKNNLDGINGSIQTGNQFNGRHAPFASANFNLKKGKWTTNSNLNYSNWARNIDLEILRRFQLENGLSVFDQDALLKLGGRSFYFSGGADYQMSKMHSLGISLQASDYNGKADGNSLTHISNPDNSDINQLRAINDSNSDNQRFFSNLHYTGKLDTIGSKLSVDLDYTFVDGASLSLLTNDYWVNEDIAGGTMDQILTDNDMNYNIFTAKSDFTKAFDKEHTFESGLKGSWVKSDNRLNISRSVEEGPFEQEPNSNHFIYEERVLAAYASYKSPLSEKIKVQGGLRMEYSYIQGNSLTLEQVNTQEYINLFPTFYLQHKLSDKYQIIYNINRRITRPNYRLLNPFVFYVDPLTTEQGNPDLKPQFATNLEMSHVWKEKYRLTLSYSRTSNFFGQVLTQEEESRKSFIQVQNFDKEEDINVRLMAPLEIADWWTVDNMLHFYHKNYQSQLGDELLDVGQFSWMARVQQNIRLPKGFKVELVGMYLSPFLEGQLDAEGMGWVDAGITKTFKNEKFTLTLNGNDILRTRRFRGKVTFDKINTDIRQYNSQQSVRLTFRWKFSKGEQFKVSNRSGSTEERNRLD